MSNVIYFDWSILPVTLVSAEITSRSVQTSIVLYGSVKPTQGDVDYLIIATVLESQMMTNISR